MKPRTAMALSKQWSKSIEAIRDFLGETLRTLFLRGCKVCNNWPLRSGRNNLHSLACHAMPCNASPRDPSDPPSDFDSWHRCGHSKGPPAPVMLGDGCWVICKSIGLCPTTGYPKIQALIQCYPIFQITKSRNPRENHPTSEP